MSGGEQTPALPRGAVSLREGPASRTLQPCGKAPRFSETRPGIKQIPVREGWRGGGAAVPDGAAGARLGEPGVPGGAGPAAREEAEPRSSKVSSSPNHQP